MWYALRHSSRRDTEAAAATADLLLAASRRLILTTAACYVAVHATATVTWPQALGWRAWALAGVMGITTAVPLFLLSRRSVAALVLWQTGLAAVVTLTVVFFHEPRAAYLYALLPLLAAVTLGWPAGILAELVTGVLLAWISAGLPEGALPFSENVGILAGGALAGLVGWAAEDTLLNVTQWSTASYSEAQAHMEEARVHRGRLAAALKDLDQAYYRLGRANAALVAAWKAAEEAERFKAEFVANVSHELRTPLNLVIGFSETMMTAPESYGGVPLPGPYRTDLNAIYHSARHLRALVDDVLDLARIDAGKITLAREEVGIDTLVAEATDIVRDYIAAKGLTLRVNIPASLPPVRIDRLRIRQVLLNLLVNAARFSEKGWIRVEAARLENEIMVRVSDTGRGIPEEDLPKIFEEFRTTEQPISAWHSGTGLGLPISKKFVELHRGRMGVESTFGQGTTFWFTLPIGGAPSPAPVPALSRRTPEDARVSAAGPAIVVVHDDPLVGPLLQRYLEGCEVATAADMQAGEEIALEMHAVALVTDAATSVPAEPRVPVIACPLPNGRQAAEALGAEDLLVKPVTQKDLLAALDRIGRPIERVLIADDDPEVVRLFQRMLLTRLPARDCREAYNGEEALALMRAEKPDLVLLDLAMPRVDGRGVLEQMSSDPRLADVPVIVVSARGHDYISLELPGPIQIHRRGGFRLGEVVRTLEAILSVLAPGAVGAGARGRAPEAAPVA
jgi:signal transduction histidine kinase/CheY-like chemotaxis protein